MIIHYETKNVEKDHDDNARRTDEFIPNKYTYQDLQYSV